MKIKTKETKLSDDSIVHDINIFPNGGTRWAQKVIISCHSEEAAEAFLAQLEILIEQYTVETLERE